MAFSKEIKYPEGSTLYVWYVTESVEDLTNMCIKKNIDIGDSSGIKSQRRKTEVLVTRLLLNLIFGEKDILRHYENGAPYIQGSNMHVSISHTTGAVCIATNGIHPIGIDIENIGTRVIKVRDKFLNETEKQWLAADDVNSNLVAWTAKEALFKVIPDSGIDLKEHLSLSFFDARCNRSVTFQSRYTKQSTPETYNLISNIYTGYIITLAYKQ